MKIRRQIMAGWMLLAVAISIQSAAAEEQVVQVTVAPLARLTINPTFSAPAKTLSLNKTRVSAETSGNILEIPVQIGDQVKQGELVARLDCRNNNIQLQQSESSLQTADAKLELAKRQLQRVRRLHKERSVTEELLNQREADLAIAKAQRHASEAAIAAARLTIEHCRIRAPYSGLVTARNGNEGEWVAPGQPVITLLDTERLEVSAQFTSRQVATLNQAVTLTYTDDSGDYSLSLKTLLPALDPVTRTREARLTFTSNRAMPGSAGRIVWKSTVGYIPADLPIRRGNTLGLLIEENGKARFMPLPGAQEGQPVRNPFPGTTQAILGGRQGLNDGDAIQQVH